MEKPKEFNEMKLESKIIKKKKKKRSVLYVWHQVAYTDRVSYFSYLTKTPF